MVNFKASLMQGEHKRALATQDGGESHAISKLEKMKLRADAECVNEDGVALRVGARELGREVVGRVKVLHVRVDVRIAQPQPGLDRRAVLQGGGEVYVVGGMGGSGFMKGPMAGQLLAKLILGRDGQ